MYAHVQPYPLHPGQLDRGGGASSGYNKLAVVLRTEGCDCVGRLLANRNGGSRQGASQMHWGQGYGGSPTDRHGGPGALFNLSQLLRHGDGNQSDEKWDEGDCWS